MASKYPAAEKYDPNVPVFVVPDATEFLLPALVAEFDFQRFVRDAIQIANENFDANKFKPNSSGKSRAEIEIRPDRNSGRASTKRKLNIISKRSRRSVKIVEIVE